MSSQANTITKAARKENMLQTVKGTCIEPIVHSLFQKGNLKRLHIIVSQNKVKVACFVRNKKVIADTGLSLQEVLGKITVNTL